MRTSTAGVEGFLETSERALSERALKRGGSPSAPRFRNHFLEVQVVDTVLDPHTAGEFGLRGGPHCDDTFGLKGFGTPSL